MESAAAPGAASTASTHHRGLAWAFAGVLIFSFTVPLTKVAVGGFDPYLTATARAAIAGILAATLLVALRVAPPAREYLRPLVITMLAAVFGWPILLALALQRTTSAHVAVIASFLPLTTALLAVLRTHERVSWQFWAAAGSGTAVLVGFALAHGGASGDDLIADLLVMAAVLCASWSYVEGASVTRVIPGWQVISWVVVMALPLTIPVSVILWWSTNGDFDTTPRQWAALVLLGVMSMYVGFFAWYRGLSLAGVARGGQVQQLQALLTLLWSAIFLDETVDASTVAVALAIIASVVWAQRGRSPTPTAGQMPPGGQGQCD